MNLTTERIGVWVGVVASAAAVWTRFVVLEESRQVTQRVLTDLTAEVKNLNEKIGQIQSDRALWERLHDAEVRLGKLEEHVADRDTKRR